MKLSPPIQDETTLDLGQISVAPCIGGFLLESTVKTQTKAERKEKRKIYLKKNAEATKAQRKEYRELHAEEIKAKRLAYDKSRVDERRAYIKKNAEKIKAQRKEYYNKNKTEMLSKEKAYRSINQDRIKSYQKYYKKTPAGKAVIAECVHRRRAREVNTPEDQKRIKAWLTKVYSKATFRCYYCDRRYVLKVLHIDHIKPLAKGGKNILNNLACSCATCNLRKKTKSVQEFTADQGGQMLLV